MHFEKQTLTIAIDPSYGLPAEVSEAYVAPGTGLGYYIDPKPEHSEPFCFINNIAIYREEDATRYVPTHIPSGMRFPQWFYQEEHVRKYILVVLALDIDWTQPVEVLQLSPLWKEMAKRCQDIAREVTTRKEGDE